MQCTVNTITGYSISYIPGRFPSTGTRAQYNIEYSAIRVRKTNGRHFNDVPIFRIVSGRDKITWRLIITNGVHTEFVYYNIYYSRYPRLKIHSCIPAAFYFRGNFLLLPNILYKYRLLITRVVFIRTIRICFFLFFLQPSATTKTYFFNTYFIRAQWKLFLLFFFFVSDCNT